MNTNASSRIIKYETDLKGLNAIMWFNKNRKVNIFGLVDLAHQYYVTYNLPVEDVFIVHMARPTLPIQTNKFKVYELDFHGN